MAQHHTCPAAFWAWLGRFLLSVLVYCLLHNQACVGSCVLFRRPMHVLKVSMCLLCGFQPQMANGWAEFSSKQALLKYFLWTYQLARHSIVLLQKFSRKREKDSGGNGDVLSLFRSQICLSLLWRDWSPRLITSRHPLSCCWYGTEKQVLAPAFYVCLEGRQTPCHSCCIRHLAKMVYQAEPVNFVINQCLSRLWFYPRIASVHLLSDIKIQFF